MREIIITDDSTLHKSGSEGMKEHKDKLEMRTTSSAQWKLSQA